jgi:hypothetical protein
MDYSDTSLKNGILQTCELLLDLGDAGITGNATLKAQFTNLLNNDAYDEVIAEILRNEGTWIWDDFNEGNTRLPVASQTLTVTAGSEVSNYALPNGSSNSGLADSDASTFLRLIKVQVKDAAGYFQNLLPIDEGAFDQPLETVFATPGFPQYYDQVGTSLILYPAPLAARVTATNGLKITFQRDKVDFVVADTTKQPGFPSIYHYLLPLIMSETWAAIKGMKQLPFITAKKMKFMQNLGWGVANRNKDLPQRVISQQTRRNPNYE